MAIDRRSIRVLAAGVSAVAILMAGNSSVVRGQAAVADLAADPAPYPAATDPNDPRTLSDQGLIIGWGWQRIDSSTSIDRFKAIAQGGFHRLALKTNSSILGWGGNEYGQARAPAGNDFIAIAAGYSHSLALKKDGSIVGWGGTATPPPGNDFIVIAAGDDHSLALKKNGSIVGWGFNRTGQATPPDGNDFIAIAAGMFHSLALKKDGSIVGWGWNDYGQAKPPAGNDFIAIAAGGYNSLAIRRAEPIASP